MKESLTWAIIWSILAVLSVVALFDNKSHVFILTLSVILAAIHWKAYLKEKNN